MNLILKYDEYLKQVYPTEALVSFNDEKKTKFSLTNDKQIKQEFTGGKKTKKFSSHQHADEKRDEKKKEDDFEIRYIENDYNVFVFNGGTSKEFETELKQLSNTNKSNTAVPVRTNIPKPVIKKEPKVIYVACLCDDRIKNSLLTTLSNKYKNEIIHNKVSILRSEKQLKDTDSDIAIIVDRNYSFKDNKISINKPKSELSFYIPNDGGSFDFAKSTFIAGNQYVYDHVKPIEYFGTNNKQVKAQNDKFINTYLDSKVTQLQNLYQHKNYTKLSRTNRELFIAVDNMLKELPIGTRILGGYEDSEGYPPYYDEEENYYYY